MFFSSIAPDPPKEELETEGLERQMHLIVHKVNPSFLRSEEKYLQSSISQNIVMPVSDPSSDIAILARRGSQLVRESRRKRESEMQVRNALNLPNPTHTSPKSRQETLEANKSTLWQRRKSLPAFACKSQLLKIIRENQIVVVVGETGSGKTTQLTQFLYEEGYHKRGIIGCTQPRRVAAVSVAKRVSDELGCDLGTKVGYSIRFEDCTSSETAIKYMTDGILLREILKDNDLDSYSTIIIDEAHERSLQTDILLGLLKPLSTRRRDIRIIITSATMNAEKFSQFFGNIPVFTIPGRTFKVDIMFSKSLPDDYVEAAVKQALTIHLTQEEGDILVFMTGQEDIETTAQLITEKLCVLDEGANHHRKDDLVVIPIYSQLPSELQSRIFEILPAGKRKCIIATNIAETSLTVEGIKYVVDSGFCKVKVYNPHIGMDTLQIFPVSQAGANQRAGRAGRTGPGICYRLYTETVYTQELLSFNVPEILRTNLSNVVLLLKSLKIVDPLSFEYLDKPPIESIVTALRLLWVLGALDDNGNLTLRGKMMAEFPLDPNLSLLLLSAQEDGCSEDAAIIVAMLSVPNVFYRPKSQNKELDAVREKFIFPGSDHLTLINVFQQWMSHRKSEDWAERNFLIEKSLHRALEIRRQLLDIFRQQRLPIKSGGSDELIRKSVAKAYVNHVAKLKRPGEYYNIITGTPCFVHPSSAVFGSSVSDYVVYHDLVLTSKEYMQHVTCVEPEWIAQSCPSLFSLKIMEYSPTGVSSKVVSFHGGDDDDDGVEQRRHAMMSKRTAEIVTEQKSSKHLERPRHAKRGFFASE